MKHSIVVEESMEVIGKTTKNKLQDIWRDGSTWNQAAKPNDGFTIRLKGVKNQAVKVQ